MNLTTLMGSPRLHGNTATVLGRFEEMARPAHQIERINVVDRTVAGFFLFCLVSSAVYIFNDLADIEKDRQHPVKRNRPLASGQLAPRVAVIAAVFLPTPWRETLMAATAAVSVMKRSCTTRRSSGSGHSPETRSRVWQRSRSLSCLTPR